MISIFIRTYRKDIHWLMYSLKSIHKNLKGWGEIVICIPTGQEHLLSHLTKEKVVVCKTYKDDYIGQQISKLEAYKHCTGEYILFVDSDVVFYEGADVRDYFIDNKPIILKEKYERVGDAICWKPVVEKLFKESVEYEYMRFAPQIFHKSTLERFAEAFSGIENYAIEQPYRQFSEFNILGFYVAKNEPENYSIIDLEFNPVPVNRSKQYWSWGSITEKVKAELEQL